jgi:hypothetical protein
MLNIVGQSQGASRITDLGRWIGSEHGGQQRVADALPFFASRSSHTSAPATEDRPGQILI